MSNKERSLQDIGRGAAECIADMVAALECDYDRLEELREELAAVVSANDSDRCSAWNASDEREELAELEKAAGDCDRPRRCGAAHT